jgi:hypothetical protein
MPRVGFEPTILVFKLPKSVRDLDRTVIHYTLKYEEKQIDTLKVSSQTQNCICHVSDSFTNQYDTQRDGALFLNTPINLTRRCADC